MVLDTPHAFLGSPDDDESFKPEVVASRLGEPDNAILALDDPDDRERLIAVAGVARMRRVKTRHRAIIWGVYCDPAHRGRGLGRAVTEAAINTARSWEGISIVALCVSARSTGAIALYHSLGFEPWGVEPDAVRVDGASYDDIHMVLRV
jgi:RimJ/RimL family protein N-acetyltransferase